MPEEPESFLYAAPTHIGLMPQYTGTGPRISNLRGPNGKNVDFSITKNTRLTERLNFQLRFAFFNAFNMHQFTLNNRTTLIIKARILPSTTSVDSQFWQLERQRKLSPHDPDRRQA